MIVTHILRIFLSIILITTIGCKAAPENKVLVHQQDVDMVASTYQKTLFSIRTAEEVATRGTSVETKNFADKFLKDKTKIKLELEKLAGRKGFELPLDITDGQIKEWKKLVSKKSWEFDKAFLNMVLSLDSTLIMDLQSLKNFAKDTDIQKTAGILTEQSENNKALVFEAQESIDFKTAQKDSVVKAATFKN